jgi:NADH-quinone oxidoreductase subunit L
MTNYAYIVWVPALPLAGFLLLGLFGRRYFKSFSGVLGTALLLASTVLAMYAAYDYFFTTGTGIGGAGIGTGKDTTGAYPLIKAFDFHWLTFSRGMSIDMSIILDPISVMMIVIVCFISLMVHIYSLGYMKGEERYGTYYAFLSLFTFSMLGLVLSGNIFETYIFWEGVGVSSFLLIGFYYDRPSAVAASKKAFIVTRFADLGFLVGILILSFESGTLNISDLMGRLITSHTAFSHQASVSFLGISAVSWGLALVFVGGAGKSAMFPLHIWLPDAMEGPTPVSALIHAATMVVAGVYLVARLFPLYAFWSQGVLQLVTWVGAVSALLAAIIACTQTDIKRVLAFSTMSQIGYMMFALGVSWYGGEKGLGYTASMFHLFTHAFFKSLLFLCAGAVIHVVHSNEMKDMGGLRKWMPLTNICFLIACLAISGIPPFAGFFSKEEILQAASGSNRVIYGIGLLTSGLTAFYMFRLYFSIFWGDKRKLQAASYKLQVGNSNAGKEYIEPGGHGEEMHGEEMHGEEEHGEKKHEERRHGEATLSMKIPLVILAVCSVLAGLVPFSRFVTSDGRPLDHHLDIVDAIVPVLIAVTGVLLASLLYRKENDQPARIAAGLGGLYRLAYRKFYIDEIYLFITKKIIFSLVGRPAAWIDKNIVDGLMNGLATATGKVSERIKGIQSGKVQSYAIWFLVGICGLALFIFIYGITNN